MGRTSIAAIDEAEDQWPHEHDDNGWPAVIIRWRTATDCSDVVPIGLYDIVQGNLQDWNTKADGYIDGYFSSL
jgi:hypothetical protein